MPDIYGKDAYESPISDSSDVQDMKWLADNLRAIAEIEHELVDPCSFHGHLHQYETRHKEWGGDYHYHVMCKKYMERGSSSWELTGSFDGGDYAFRFAQEQSSRLYEITDAKVERYSNDSCRHCEYKVRIDDCEFDAKHPLQK